MKLWTVLIAATLVLAGCTTMQPADPATVASQAAPATNTRPSDGGRDSIRLQRGPCLGKCPVYSVELRADGRVHYLGERNVPSPGETRSRIDAQTYSRLAERFAAADFGHIPDIYGRGGKGCGPIVTDMPTVVLSQTVSSETHTVHYYTGCKDAPAILSELAQAVDQAAGLDASGGAVSLMRSSQ